MCIEFGVMSNVRSFEPLEETVKLMCIINLPSATTFSCDELPSAKYALAPLTWRIISVTFPVGAFVAPNRTLLLTKLVRLTLVPVLEGTL